MLLLIFSLIYKREATLKKMRNIFKSKPITQVTFNDQVFKNYKALAVLGKVFEENKQPEGKLLLEEFNDAELSAAMHMTLENITPKGAMEAHLQFQTRVIHCIANNLKDENKLPHDFMLDEFDMDKVTVGTFKENNFVTTKGHVPEMAGLLQEMAAEVCALGQVTMASKKAFACIIDNVE